MFSAGVVQWAGWSPLALFLLGKEENDMAQHIVLHYLMSHCLTYAFTEDSHEYIFTYSKGDTNNLVGRNDHFSAYAHFWQRLPTGENICFLWVTGVIVIVYKGIPEIKTRFQPVSRCNQWQKMMLIYMPSLPCIVRQQTYMSVWVIDAWYKYHQIKILTRTINCGNQPEQPTEHAFVKHFW